MLVTLSRCLGGTAWHSYAEVDIFYRNPGPASGFAACPGVPRALLLSLKDTDVRNASPKSEVHNFHGSYANWQALTRVGSKNCIPNLQTLTDGLPVDLHGARVSSQDHEPVWGSPLPISILACPGPRGCSQLVLCGFASLWNTNENNIFLSWTMCYRHWSISINYRQLLIISEQFQSSDEISIYLLIDHQMIRSIRCLAITSRAKVPASPTTVLIKRVDGVFPKISSTGSTESHFFHTMHDVAIPSKCHAAHSSYNYRPRTREWYFNINIESFVGVNVKKTRS